MLIVMRARSKHRRKKEEISNSTLRDAPSALANSEVRYAVQNTTDRTLLRLSTAARIFAHAGQRFDRVLRLAERWCLRAQSFVNSVLRCDATGPLKIKLLGRVRALLRLDTLDTLDDDEAAFFADLDFNDLRVHKYSLHTEALASGLHSVRAQNTTGIVQFPDATA